MTHDPNLFRDPVQAIGSPEDPKATDPHAPATMIALLKGILAATAAPPPKRTRQTEGERDDA